jgi:hypothetical protein
MTKLIVAFRSFANEPKGHPNFESEYLQLCITTLRPYVTNEQISIVISLTFSSILDLSQHSILLKRICQTSFQPALWIRALETQFWLLFSEASTACIYFGANELIQNTTSWFLGPILIKFFNTDPWLHASNKISFFFYRQSYVHWSIKVSYLLCKIDTNLPRYLSNFLIVRVGFFFVALRPNAGHGLYHSWGF